MGKSVAKGLKYRGEVLIEEFPEKFGKDFSKNKKVLHEEFAEMKLSKTTRNILAGYIVRVAKRKEEAKLA